MGKNNTLQAAERNLGCTRSGAVLLVELRDATVHSGYFSDIRAVNPRNASCRMKLEDHARSLGSGIPLALIRRGLSLAIHIFSS